MKVISMTVKGKEYAYITSETHGAPQKLVYKICDALNSVRYGIAEDKPELVWHVYDIDPNGFNNGAVYAMRQRFGTRKGKLVEIRA